MFHTINDKLDSAIIMASIRAEMASKYLDELLRASNAAAISKEEAATALGSLTLNERRDICNLPKVEDIEPIELKELEVGKGLIPLTCKMCGGTLDHGLTCTFCGTRYKWR